MHLTDRWGKRAATRKCGFFASSLRIGSTELFASILSNYSRGRALTATPSPQGLPLSRDFIQEIFKGIPQLEKNLRGWGGTRNKMKYNVREGRRKGLMGAEKRALSTLFDEQ